MIFKTSADTAVLDSKKTVGPAIDYLCMAALMASVAVSLAWIGLMIWGISLLVSL